MSDHALPEAVCLEPIPVSRAERPRFGRLARISPTEQQRCVARCRRAVGSRALGEALLRLSPDLRSGWPQAERRSAESLLPAARAMLARLPSRQQRATRREAVLWRRRASRSASDVPHRSAARAYSGATARRLSALPGEKCRPGNDARNGLQERSDACRGDEYMPGGCALAKMKTILDKHRRHAPAAVCAPCP
jgi:hypothetical protein